MNWKCDVKMDNCFVDITLEFLGVVFHSILFYVGVYPKSVFEPKRKYNIVVHRSVHPEISKYIDLCLKSVGECLKNSQLSRVDFAITDSTYKPIITFVFNFIKGDFDDTTDAYLIQVEQNIRAFCLKLSSVCHQFKSLPEDCSFSIFIHTNESTAVSMTNNPDLEEFPMIEVEEKYQESDNILPLRSFAIRNYNLEAFVEL